MIRTRGNQGSVQARMLGTMYENPEKSPMIHRHHPRHHPQLSFAACGDIDLQGGLSDSGNNSVAEERCKHAHILHGRWLRCVWDHRKST